MMNRIIICPTRNWIAEINHAGNQSASFTNWAMDVQQVRKRVNLTVAGSAFQFSDVSMELSYQFGFNPRPQMKIINVLRNEKLQLAYVLQLDNG